MKSKKEIEAFTKALAQFMVGVYKGGGQPPIWPIPLEENLWYLGRCFLPELYRTIKKVETKGISEEKIAHLFKGTFIISHFLELAEVMKFCELKKEEKLYLVKKLINYLKYYRKKNIIFCENGRNILWGQEEVNKILDNLRLIDVNEYTKKNLQEINGRLWLFSENLHGIFHCCGYELHGPYQINKDEFLLVRDHFGLKPVEIWPSTAKLGFDRIVSYEIYKNVDFKIDFLGHPISSVSLTDYLQRFQMLIDGKPLINPSQLILNCDLVLEEMSAIFASLTKKEWEKKFIELHFYYLKPCKDLLEESWRPSPKIFEFIDKKEPDKIFLKEMEELAKVGKLPKREALKKLKQFYLNSIYK